MRTIQMTLDDDLVDTVDSIVKSLKTSRSAFTREALRDAIEKYDVNRMEEKHRKGYQRFPVGVDEFSGWEDEQVWGDA
ncbi:putative transcriptional regulator, CopG family [Desulfamplus magnetovallimortis]|uniref:Putative transcriptional regulator, CopG family n=1 Tax=Desulfamplus magnetovallimortis TaxID=1246637 RepID=A0A1W1HJG3_9BACT|nr:ribbon-helix-helix protein, CopG family [Desulfamplus magnetovallimortis]SLM32498.1 putative transcriptional regulator, CopG family [Desulfamplus magnetovallimortis]